MVPASGHSRGRGLRPLRRARARGSSNDAPAAGVLARSTGAAATRARADLSDLPFSGWGGVFGNQAIAAAMIDRVVHRADVLTLKGASYRLRNRGIDTLPSIPSPWRGGWGR